MSMIEASKICAACGGPIVQLIGDEFCSEPCKKAGRARCRQCGKPLAQKKNGTRKYCGSLCRSRYRSGVEEAAQDWKPTICWGCKKPIIQSRNGHRRFHNKSCSTKYHRAARQGKTSLEKWGDFAPEVRRSLRDMETFVGKRAATRLATAINHEYTLKPTAYAGRDVTMITCRCKICGEEFHRRPWGKQSKEYCSKHVFEGRRGPAPKASYKLTREQVNEILTLHATEHLPYSQIAKRYGVSKEAIGQIIRYGGKRHTTGTLTREQDDEIRSDYATGKFTQAELARKYSVHPSTIKAILSFKGLKEEKPVFTQEQIEEIHHLYHTEHWSLEMLYDKYGVGEKTMRKYLPERRYVSSKVTREQANEIRMLYAMGAFTQKELGERFGITREGISRIVRYKNRKSENKEEGWDKKTDEIYKLHKRHSSAKLTWEQVDEIRHLYETKHLTPKALAGQYDIDESSIRRIIRYEYWKPEQDPRRKELTQAE